MVAITMFDANDFITTVMLNDEPYKLHFSWNDNAKQWYVDVLTNDNIEIARGLSVVPNLPLFSFYRRERLPLGELMAVIVNQDDDENQSIGRQDFLNGKATLVYIPAEELNDALETSL
jgi:hypothetical protein